MKKDTLKCKEWERRRRDRLNDAFNSLAQLLPHYDPAKVAAKIDILEKSTQFVKELRLSNSRLLTTQTQQTEMSTKIKELQDEVNKLILRVKQLTILLNQAKIPIPTGPSIKLLGKRRFKWTNRLCAENSENVNRLKDPSHVPAVSRKTGDTSLSDAAEAESDPKVPRLTNIEKEVGSKKLPKTKIIVISAPACPKEAGSNGPLKETNTPVDGALSTKGSPSQATAVKEPIQPAVICQEQPVQEAVPVTGDSAPKLQVTPPPPVSMSTSRTSTLPTIILTQSPQPQPVVVTLGRPQQRIMPKFTLVNTFFQIPKVPIMRIRRPLPPPKPKLVRRRVTKEPKILVTCETQTMEEVASCPVEGAVESDVIADAKVMETEAEVITIPGSPLPELIDISGDKPMDSEVTLETANENPQVIPTSPLKVCSDLDTDSVNKPELMEATGERELVEELEISTIPENYAESTQNSDQVAEIETRAPEISKDPLPIPEESIVNPKAADPEPEAEQEVQELEPASASKPESLENPVELDIHTPPKPVTTIPSDAVLKPRDILDETCLTSDKISECIARSMDLIEHPENVELMELGTDWGSHSPKSPISPTQMFLSMFPLLPRESIVTVAAETSQQHKSSSRSSFYIDSMLPEDQPSHSTSFQNLESENHFRNLLSVSTTCLAMTPLVPIQTSTKSSKNDLSFNSSLDSFNKVLAPLQNFKEKRHTQAMYEPTSTRSSSTILNVPNSSTTATDSRTSIKSSSSKKFLTLLESASAASSQETQHQHPNFFPYTPMTSMEPQSHSMSQFFNNFSNSGTATSTPYSQSQTVVASSAQMPFSSVSSTNSRQTDFDFNFRQNYYPNQEISTVTSANSQIPQQQQTLHVRQSSATTPKEPAAFSQAHKPNSGQKTHSELFRPAPNVFLGNNMNQNAGTSKQPAQKASRDTHGYRSISSVPRACHTKVTNSNANPVTTSAPTTTCVRHQNMSYTHSQPSIYQVPPQTQVTGGHGHKQVPSFQPQPRNTLPLPPSSIIPTFSPQKPAASMDTSTEGNHRPRIPASIPAPDFSYSNQTYHPTDTHYFHDPNSRPFYQTYSNTPPVANKPSRAPPYYLPDPAPPVAYDTYPAQNSSVQPAPTVNSQSQGQASHFPQNPNFFPPVYNNPNPTNPVAVAKECTSQAQNQMQGQAQGQGQPSHAYNPVPPPPKSSTHEYFQYSTNQHHRPAPTVPTASPSPKKPPATNFPTGPQQQVSNAGMKRSNSSNSNSTVQQQRPVNWMTDNSTYKKGTTVVNNPFSVSKLVGTHPGNNPSSSYCAEALIRKNSNNSNWNDFQFGSNPNPPIPQPPPSDNSSQFQGHGAQSFVSQPQPAQQLPNTQYPVHNFPHQQHQYQHHQHHNPYSRNFNQFDNSQQHHQNPGGPGSNVQQGSSASVNSSGTTSSISNFNLSSIFPEINDKSKNTTGNNSANNCNYYLNRK